MDTLSIRFAQQGDAEGILRIYAPFVQDTFVSMEYEVPSLDAFRKRISGIAAEYPYLVCAAGDEIAGYAYAHRHMERAGYAWNAELSVYIGDGYRRRGVGRALYGALMDILRLQGVRNVYGIITLPNPGSETLHESFGFLRAGVYRQSGFKHGAWHDVAWYEKQIGGLRPQPEPFVPIGQVDPEAVSSILARHGGVLRAE